MIWDLPKYYNALDREYDNKATQERPLAEVSIKDIGISSNPMTNQLDQLRARIFQGASKVELGFSGAGKGSMGQQNTTPEMYGMDERQDIRDLAKINKIQLTTHASFNIGPLSGMTQQGFDENAREKSLREIERAIDFAGDTAGGGAVVVHANEFFRPISEAYGKEGFKMFEEEDKKANISFVDNETGKIQSISKDQVFSMPKWVGEGDGKDFSHVKAGANGWPEPDYNREKKEFEMKEMRWQDFEKLADWYNKTHAREIEDGKKRELSPAEAFIRLNTEMQIQSSLSWAKQYREGYDQAIDIDEDRTRSVDYSNRTGKVSLQSYSVSQAIESLRMEISKEEQQKREISDPDKVRRIMSILEGPLKTKIEKDIERYKGILVAQYQQARNQEAMLDRLKPIEDYAIERTADTIARAAESAHRKSRYLAEQGKLNSPIYVAPENIFPEMYGAHPQELKKIIDTARNKYVDLYKNQVGGEQAARKLAEQHIRGTFDIGHAYVWRKYYQENPKLSTEENEKNFQKWLFDQIDDLNKNHYIGHLHVSDNFGWEDEHVTPGQGRAPIKEFIDRMKKAGINDITVEPAHQDYRAVLGAWREFGAPIYGADRSVQRWTDVEHSYFGKTRSPYFIFGEYAPSNEYTLWSQVPLE